MTEPSLDEIPDVADHWKPWLTPEHHITVRADQLCPGDRVRHRGVGPVQTVVRTRVRVDGQSAQIQVEPAGRSGVRMIPWEWIEADTPVTVVGVLRVPGHRAD